MLLKTLVLLLLVCFSYSKAEEKDTGNILTPADEWTLYDDASITQCSYSGTLEDGEVCTGNADQGGTAIGGGGIISEEYSLLDQGLSKQEIQQGFDFEYGATIESHISNETVPSCENTTYDCKDYFTIKLYVNKSDGSLINLHEHTVEMDYSGQKDYKYYETIGTNNYDDVLFKMDIWSVDAGYTSGMYGGIISDPFLSVQYKTVEIVTDIITDIVNDIIYEEIKMDEVSFEVVIEDFYQEDLSFEFDLAPVEAPMEFEMPEVQEVEMEIQAEIEEQMIEEMPEIEPEVVEETTEEEVKEEAPTEMEIKQKIANKLMASQKDKMSTEAQTTQLALMVILADVGFDSYLEMQLADGEFYKDVGLKDQNVIIDYQAGILGYMDYGMINEMVDSQWE